MSLEIEVYTEILASIVVKPNILAFANWKLEFENRASINPVCQELSQDLELIIFI